MVPDKSPLRVQGRDRVKIFRNFVGGKTGAVSGSEGHTENRGSYRLPKWDLYVYVAF